jgi:hypothetical protein
MTEKRPVIIGENRPNSYSTTMTKSEALRYARRIMPKDLARAGFSASIFASDPELHGGLWWRVNYSK